jgi:voltage-gated potassium channel
VVLHDEAIFAWQSDGKTILSVLALKKELPSIYVCAQLMDENNVIHCKRAGADEIIVTGGLTAKLLGQAVLDHGVTKIVSEILSNQYGNELYKVKCPRDYHGKNFLSILADFKSKYNGIIIGVERRGELMTNPDSNTILEPGDLLIIIAEKRPIIE